MNIIDFPTDQRKLIRKQLDDDFKIKPLKKITVRIRKLYQQKKYKTPNPFLITTTKSKKYKALIGPSYLNHQFETMVFIQDKLKKLELSPEIISSGDGFLIAEYLDGNVPIPNDEYFVTSFSKIFAKIHNIDTSTFNTNQIRIDAVNIINKFIQDHKIKSNILKILEKKLPAYLSKGITYADHNINNYLWCNNKLKLIDFGSFQKNVPLDFNLSGSVLFNLMNEANFWKSYLKEGGLESVFINRKIAKILGFLFAIDYNYQRYKDVPFFDFRLKNARKINVKSQLKMLKSYCDTI
jgi:hypothetical protein